MHSAVLHHQQGGRERNQAEQIQIPDTQNAIEFEV
jgi:hypothetical protein